MSECVDCGASASKNASGYYRDRCLECICEDPPGTPHREQCDEDDCMICTAP